MENRPIIIVGAGPAGTATALALHRLDPMLARDVLVLEKARHPRPKVCAGGLIPAGRRWLHRAETSAALRASPRETALNQIVLAEVLACQGDAETARRTMTEAAGKLRARNMQWHAAQATRWLETGASISRC